MDGDPEYKVEYKKPPRDTQYKPGQSGNPNGRPKRDPTLAEAFKKQLRARVTTNVDGKPKKMSFLDAIAMQHTRKASAGDVKSTKLVIQLSEPPRESDAGRGLPPILEIFRGMNAKHETENTPTPEVNEKKGEPDEHD